MRLAFAAPLIVFAADGAPAEPSGEPIVTADAGTSAPVDAGTQVTPDAGEPPADAGAAPVTPAPRRIQARADARAGARACRRRRAAG